MIISLDTYDITVSSIIVQVVNNEIRKLIN